MGNMVIYRMTIFNRCYYAITGGYVYFIGAVEWLKDKKQEYEDRMRQMQKKGIWRWVLMKESPDSYCIDDYALIYAFKVLK